jgi:hypothetical protein
LIWSLSPASQLALNIFNDFRIVRLMVEIKLESEEHCLGVFGGEHEDDELIASARSWSTDAHARARLCRRN